MMQDTMSLHQVTLVVLLYLVNIGIQIKTPASGSDASSGDSGEGIFGFSATTEWSKLHIYVKSALESFKAIRRPHLYQNMLQMTVDSLFCFLHALYVF